MTSLYNEPIKTTNTQTNRGDTMTDLISKLSKVDQRNVKLAIIHASNGNYRAIDSMIRGANNKSAPILTAIRASL